MDRRTFMVGTVACFAGAGGFAMPAVALADRPLTELHMDELHDQWLKVCGPSDKPNAFSQWLLLHLNARVRRNGERIRLVYGKHHRVYGSHYGLSSWRLGGSAYFHASEALDRYDGVDYVWKSRYRELGRYVAETNQRIAA